MNKGRKRSSLLLMETLIAITFFSLIGAICLRIFVSSHLIGKESSALNRAIVASESTASIITACLEGGDDASLSFLMDSYPLAVVTDHDADLGFDADFDSCPLSVAAYQCHVRLTPDPEYADLWQITQEYLSIDLETGSNESFYNLNWKLYVP